MALGLEFYSNSDSHEHLKRKKKNTKLLHAQKVETQTNLTTWFVIYLA